MPSNVRDETRQREWTVTNRTTDRTIDANGAVAVIGDGLATLIEDLIEAGIISGSVS